MVRYEILGFSRRKNKEGKEYNLACLLMRLDNDFEIVRCLVNDKQVSELELFMDESENNDITSLCSTEYNQYQKKFELKINV